jgi:hypothetical protein
MVPEPISALVPHPSSQGANASSSLHILLQKALTNIIARNILVQSYFSWYKQIYYLKIISFLNLQIDQQKKHKTVKKNSFFARQGASIIQYILH